MIPKLGDTIQATKPTQIDTPWVPSGTVLRCVLSTPEAVEYARELVASGRWEVVRGDK